MIEIIGRVTPAYYFYVICTKIILKFVHNFFKNSLTNTNNYDIIKSQDRERKIPNTRKVKNMKDMQFVWVFENGLKVVRDCEIGDGIYVFRIYTQEEKFIGAKYPNSAEETQEIIKGLNNGILPKLKEESGDYISPFN